MRLHNCGVGLNIYLRMDDWSSAWGRNDGVMRAKVSNFWPTSVVARVVIAMCQDFISNIRFAAQ